MREQEKKMNLIFLSLINHTTTGALLSKFDFAGGLNVFRFS